MPTRKGLSGGGGFYMHIVFHFFFFLCWREGMRRDASDSLTTALDERAR